MRFFVLLTVVTLCCGQRNVANTVPSNEASLHVGLSEGIGNFSLELLYHTAKSEDKQNLIISPVTTWTALAVIAEGARGDTLSQIKYALRLTRKNETRKQFQNIAKWLQVNTSTVELAKVNAIFVDQNHLPEKDFRKLAKDYYDTDMVQLNFTSSENSANLVNLYISRVTHGRIPKIIKKDYFNDAQMLLASAVYFKGQWTAPFNVSQTSKMPFYSSFGQKIGEVNMMYSRFTYPFSLIKELQARVIELPYGNENRLSMLIMLPNPGVSLEDMFLNFKTVPLDQIFSELKTAREEYGEDEVDCFIPRFKIVSDLILTDIIKKFGIVDLFDRSRAMLPYMARTPMYVTKVVHKAEIDVTEEGTTATAVTTAEFANRIGVVRFEANRPFSYLIIEKMTNSIVFGGVYQQPSLY